MGYIRNAVQIHAAIEDVFNVTNDVRTWPDLFTEYASSEVLEEVDNSVTFRLTTHPDDTGTQWSWTSTRWTDSDRKSTYSERNPEAGPFKHMVIRWWYDKVGDMDTIMTWEQEFTLKPEAPFNDAHATNHLNCQTRIQQQIIKERVEQRYGASGAQGSPYRGVIIAKYKPGSEDKIVDAFTRSDLTDLPRQIGVKSRHVWVQGEIYVHFIEGQTTLPDVLKEYAQHPLFQEVKGELDQYVSLIYPDQPPSAKLVYTWRSEDRQSA
jgi:aromatase